MNRIIFIHGRLDKSNPRGGITIAAEIDENNRVIAAAEAYCHPKDNYNKRTGRAKAAGRLKSPRYRTLITNNPSADEFVKAFHKGFKEAREVVTTAKALLEKL